MTKLFTELPAELIINVIRFLDYADLMSLSRTNTHMKQLVTQHYFNYILSLKHQMVRLKLDRWFQLLRPSRQEVFRLRMLNYRSFFYVFESGRAFIHQFEIIRLFNAMVTRDRLKKLLAQRPSRSELVERGILKPDDSYANDFPLKPKIDSLERENFSGILKIFIRGYEKNRTRLSETSKFVEFIRNVNFFEGLVAKNEKPVGKCVKKKVLLNVQIENGRVTYF